MTYISPNWARPSHDLRIRQDIPDATNTRAGKTIVKNDSLVGAISGAAQGLIAGTGAGAITVLKLSEGRHPIHPAGIMISLGAGLSGALIGGIIGGILGHKKAETELAKAELGMQTPPKGIFDRNSLGRNLESLLIK